MNPKKIYFDLVNSLATNPNEGAHCFSEIDAHYQEPHRAYHNWAHISSGLGELLKLKTSPSLLWSYIYRDAIYDTRASNNEALSADLMVSHSQKLGMEGKFINSCQQLILATTHTCSPSHPDEELICDVDLSILGQPREIYQKYETSIQQEYNWVTPEAYSAGRSLVLQKFLIRAKEGTLFRTNIFRLLNSQAITNLTGALESL